MHRYTIIRLSFFSSKIDGRPGLFLLSGIDTEKRVQTAVSAQCSQEHDSGEDIEHDGRNPGIQLVSEINKNSAQNDPDDPVRRTFVLFHRFVLANTWHNNTIRRII